MESPACLVFSYFIFTGPLPVTPPIVALFIMWQMHYFHRAFIYPFQLQVRAGSSTPLRMTLFGAILCTACGYLKRRVYFKIRYPLTIERLVLFAGFHHWHHHVSDRLHTQQSL